MQPSSEGHALSLLLLSSSPFSIELDAGRRMTASGEPPQAPTEPAGHEIEVRAEATCATGGALWQASGVMADVLHERQRAARGPQPKQTILELGCGTGYLAMRLATATRGTKVIATDIPDRMRSLSYNVNRNQLRHAIQCVPWDWNDEEPPTLPWHSVTQCVASEVVYYDETRGAVAALAKALATVLRRCRTDVEVLLMLRVRVLDNVVSADGTTVQGSGNSTLVPSDSYDARSSVFAFIEQALPRVGLRAELLPLGDVAAASGAGRGLRLYQIFKAPAFDCIQTAPIFEPPIVRQAIAHELQKAWMRYRHICRPSSPSPDTSTAAPATPAVAVDPDGARSSTTSATKWTWRYEVEIMPASASAEILPEDFVMLATSAGGLAARWQAEGLCWLGWRLGGGFYGVHQIVLIARTDGSLSSGAVTERLMACTHVQSARVRSVTRLEGDPFAMCVAVARSDVRVEALPLTSGLTAAHVRQLLSHGYTVCDGFVGAPTVASLAHLVHQSLGAHARVDDDAIKWQHISPQHARDDLTTWVSEGVRPATDACFASSDGVLAALSRLETDLHMFMHLRGVRELQLAAYTAGSSGYRKHTDAMPQSVSGTERKVTAILYSNATWTEADGGQLRLWLADHDGNASVDVEPKGGRLLLFLSGCMAHQVLPTHADRLALTAWYH